MAPEIREKFDLYINKENREDKEEGIDYRKADIFSLGLIFLMMCIIPINLNGYI